MQRAKRKRRRTWPEPVRQRYEELFLVDKLPPSGVEARLRVEFPEEYADGLTPGLRTLYNIQNELLGSEREGWSLLDGDADEARLALPVMRAMNRPGGFGPLGWNLPKPVVHWIAKVRTADPDIPPREAFFQAMRYLQAENGISEPAEADRWLVLKLWEGKDQ